MHSPLKPPKKLSGSKGPTNTGKPRRFSEAQMLTIFGQTAESEKEWSDCEVLFRGNEMVVSYFKNPSYVIYKGCVRNDSSFQLSASEVQGVANLSWRDDHESLEGSWREVT